MIQEGLSVTSQSMCIKYWLLVNPLVKLAQAICAVRLTDHLRMTIAVDLYLKPQTKQDNVVLVFFIGCLGFKPIESECPFHLKCMVGAACYF